MSIRLNRETAIEIWTSNNYIYINKCLAGRHYHKTDIMLDYIEWNGKMYRISEIIKTLINSMLPFGYFSTKYHGCFYRGEVYSLLTESSYNRETFTSICSDYEQAVSFSESNVMFKITVDPEVFCIPTGIENELLIEPNIYWKYLGREGKFYLVHILPFNSEIKNYGDLLDEYEECVRSNKHSQNNIKDDEFDKLRNNVESNSFNDVGNLYDLILMNLDCFNINESPNYDIDDFRADIKALNIQTGLANMELMFQFYKSNAISLL